MEERGSLGALLDVARGRGARAAEVLRVDRTVLTMDSARARPATSEGGAWTVRIWLDGGRAGVASGSDPDAVIDGALRLARAAPPDPLAGPVDRMTVRTLAMGIDDRRWGSLAEEDRVEVLALAERALDRAPFRYRGLRYTQERTRRSWASTRGTEAREQATRFLLEATAEVGELEVRHSIASRHFSDVASLPFGPDLRRRAESLAAEIRLPAEPLSVVLEPRVVAELARALAPAFAADRVRGDGFLRDWVGRPLADTSFHLTDDAGLFGGLCTRAFDDRGVPPIAVTLLREGVVHGFFHDPESARALGLRPTGHCTEGGLHPANLVVRPGSRTRNVILGELGRYFLLDRLPPLDPRTGRFTGVVPVVLGDHGERLGAGMVPFDFHVGEVLRAFRELAADQERANEVDSPSAVLDIPLIPR